MLNLLPPIYLVSCFLFCGVQSVADSVCHPPRVSVCSECTGSGPNPSCQTDGLGQFCFKQQTFTSSGVTTVKGTAHEFDCRGNISKSSLVNPACATLHPPVGTVCYDCCTSCDVHDLRCNDADVIDSRHIPQFIHQAAQMVTTSLPDVITTHAHVHPPDGPTDPTHITSANRHEPICQSGNMLSGYQTVECSDTHPFCMNDVFYDAGGIEKIIDTTKRCVSLSECVGEWWLKSKDRTECMTGDLTHLLNGNVLCHYCCLSDISTPCNTDTRLTNNYQFHSLRTTAASLTRPTTSDYHICPFGWVHHGNSCYLFSSENKTWSEAAAICQAFHAELAITESYEENHFIVQYFMSHHGNFSKHKLWLDATDRALEGHWIWAATLHHMTFEYWAPGQPDDASSKQDCLALNGQSNYMWTDENCDLHMNFVCEIKKDH